MNTGDPLKEAILRGIADTQFHYLVANQIGFMRRPLLRAAGHLGSYMIKWQNQALFDLMTHNPKNLVRALRTLIGPWLIGAGVALTGWEIRNIIMGPRLGDAPLGAGEAAEEAGIGDIRAPGPLPFGIPLPIDFAIDLWRIGMGDSVDPHVRQDAKEGMAEKLIGFGPAGVINQVMAQESGDPDAPVAVIDQPVLRWLDKTMGTDFAGGAPQQRFKTTREELLAAKFLPGSSEKRTEAGKAKRDALFEERRLRRIAKRSRDDIDKTHVKWFKMRKAASGDKQKQDIADQWHRKEISSINHERGRHGLPIITDEEILEDAIKVLQGGSRVDMVRMLIKPGLPISQVVHRWVLFNPFLTKQDQQIVFQEVIMPRQDRIVELFASPWAKEEVNARIVEAFRAQTGKK
jgi:hypothetical protein